VAAAVLFLQGCAGSDLANQVDEVRERLAVAREKGAYRCAPRELAVGEANAEFAERDFDKGDFFAARDYLAKAQVSSKEALRLASDDRVCPKRKAVPPTPIVDPNADRDRDGVPDRIDRCPDEPEDRDGFEDEDGCPDPDNDKDGIVDTIDRCPNDPEDMDGFEDEDGCPDPDNDRDRILDANDKCPNEPETYNGFEDEDGCPDKGLVIVQRGKLEILDKIYFETDKDVIKEVSFPLLDAIAATIKGHPEIALIEIQGHADERGDDEHNLDLTDRRAHSVMRALEDRGVELGRLKARGYGETKPVCTQHNEDCWSKNRRVEFIILKRVDEAILQNDSGQ
jgi:outer membrane protein OmpA-like peptidoglycan-associated protein